MRDNVREAYDRRYRSYGSNLDPRRRLAVDRIRSIIDETTTRLAHIRTVREDARLFILINGYEMVVEPLLIENDVGLRVEESGQVVYGQEAEIIVYNMLAADTAACGRVDHSVKLLA